MGGARMSNLESGGGVRYSDQTLDDVLPKVREFCENANGTFEVDSMGETTRMTCERPDNELTIELDGLDDDTMIRWADLTIENNRDLEGGGKLVTNWHWESGSEKGTIYWHEGDDYNSGEVDALVIDWQTEPREADAHKQLRGYAFGTTYDKTPETHDSLNRITGKWEHIQHS